MMYNLTQHKVTADQQAAGIVDLPDWVRKDVIFAGTFETCPDGVTLRHRAREVAAAIQRFNRWVDDTPADERAWEHCAAVIIGGAPFFMAALTEELQKMGLRVGFAFSRRESVETVGADGAVTKTSVFRHAGIVWAD